MAAYEAGYKDEQFQYPVGQTLHCSICLNVFKDPVKCRNREHLFCRNCITEHLKNQQNCPLCQEPLTVDTLGQTPQTVTNLLAELKIRCEFYKRGCGKFIELGNLENHLRECGFAPTVCSNEGCQLEVNKQDLLHHETAVCEQRRVQCHSCNDIRQEMDIVKVNLAAMNVKLATIEQLNNENLKINDTRFERMEMNVKAVQENVVEKVDQVQEQLNNQEVTIREVRSDIVEIKKTLHAITKQLENMTQQTLQRNQSKKEKSFFKIPEQDSFDILPVGNQSKKEKCIFEMPEQDSFDILPVGNQSKKEKCIFEMPEEESIDISPTPIPATRSYDHALAFRQEKSTRKKKSHFNF